MPFSKFKILIAIVMLSLATKASSQEVLATAGEHYSSGTLQINFTLGQLINGLAATGAIHVNQGFHQVFAEVVETLGAPDNSVEISVFPNPVSTNLTIRTDYPDEIRFVLYDLNGAKIASGNFIETTQLSVSDFAKGMYQLFLTNVQEELLQAFKVQLQ